MIAPGEITGIILCGGKAQRMLGAEKPLRLLSGAPLVEHVRRRLAPQVSRVVISANRELDRYAAWGDTVVPDAMAGLGPLGGLESALRVVTTPYTFCCPGDAPLLDRQLVSRLTVAMERVDTPVDVCFPHDGERPQPLFLLLRSVCQATLHDYLQRGERSVFGWLATCRQATIDASAIQRSFLNINTEQDLLLSSAHEAHYPAENV